MNKQVNYDGCGCDCGCETGETNTFCIKFPAGPQGEKGEQGERGEKGEKGDRGERGETGATGAKGEKGDKGDRGERGETGATGAKGEKGDKGDRGERGETGATGAKGEKGDKGDRGERGETGAAGAKGEKGDKGDPGAAGQILNYASFYAVMPNDNCDPIAAGCDVCFPSCGAAAGTAIKRANDSSFILDEDGVYLVMFQVGIKGSGQLVLALNGCELDNTVVGHGTETSQAVGMTVISAAAGTMLSVRNPKNNSPIEVAAGKCGEQPVTAQLIITQIGRTQQ